jgi:RNA polymerase sigma factor (sigma-70 family)
MAASDSNDSSLENGHWFVTTHWSVVLAARNGDSPHAAECLEKLCRTYWRPLYSFIRRNGHQPEEAKDLTQGFFARLLEKNHLAHLRHQEGKFRSFLLTLLKHYLSDERDKARAQKRGGGQALTFLDALSEEERYCVEPTHDSSPEILFDKRWAETVLQRAYDRLREEYREAGKAVLFEALKESQFRQAGENPSYAELAAKLGMTESAVTSAKHRLRRRHSEILRDEVAQTVACREEIDEEIRYLIKIVSVV